MRTKKGTAPIPNPRHTIEDIDLEGRIANFLYRQHIPNGERIHADAHLGTVIVRGQLPSRHAKWLCMECCRHVAGVIKLIDHVVVKPDNRRKRVDSRYLKAA